MIIFELLHRPILGYLTLFEIFCFEIFLLKDYVCAQVKGFVLNYNYFIQFLMGCYINTFIIILNIIMILSFHVYSFLIFISIHLKYLFTFIYLHTYTQTKFLCMCVWIQKKCVPVCEFKKTCVYGCVLCMQFNLFD